MHICKMTLLQIFKEMDRPSGIHVLLFLFFFLFFLLFFFILFFLIDNMHICRMALL